jgi:hypothetical protein
MRARSVVTVVVVAAVALGGYVVARDWLLPRLSTGCTANAGGHTTRLDPEQMGNAATIAAVGRLQGLPVRGVEVALITALQESKLHNLSYGDRDSIGLFQQRPSQGWGTREQIADPRYASGKFYEELRRIPDWQELPLNDAAQQVQRSGHPTAYSKWEATGITVAQALSGAEGAAVACKYSTRSLGKQDVGTDGLTPRARALSGAIRSDFGSVPVRGTPEVRGRELEVQVPGESEPTPRGWALANWAVAHSRDYGVTRVSYHTQRWTAKSGDWTAADRTTLGGGMMHVEVAKGN